MDLPQLTPEWATTRNNLHRASIVVGAVQKAMIDPLPNALHLSLFVTSQGLTTRQFADGRSILLDFRHGFVRLLDANGKQSHGWGLGTVSPQALTENLSSQLDVSLTNDDDALMPINTQDGENYATTLFQVYSAFARFKARLFGMMSPVVIWTHHFDLSFVWFTGNDADEHTAPHINFGFAPHSAGFEMPYIYVYGWSPEKQYVKIDPPAPSKWHEETFTGVVLDYETLRGYIDPSAMIESTLMKIKAEFSKTL